MKMWSDYLIIIGAIIGFSAASAFLADRKRFSTNIFMGSVSICVCILTWIPLIPSYFIILSILIVGAMIFKDGIPGRGESSI